MRLDAAILVAKLSHSFESLSGLPSIHIQELVMVWPLASKFFASALKL